MAAEIIAALTRSLRMDYFSLIYGGTTCAPSPLVDKIAPAAESHRSEAVATT
jgi:hypothetical protein